ncbi:MAG TPA: DUF4012 domain-containing protein [Acidimicrobiales bacterium]|nr:DUF4012 domain-containing protein [Acidimicrobiales bacterium]
MGPPWAHAFIAAALITAVGTPYLRRMALATGFVDDPFAAHKIHKDPTPYLGGLGLIAGVLVGMLFSSRHTAQVAVIALGGSLIGCLGLLDDHRSTGAGFRFAVEVGVAAVALAAGLRIHATDIVAIDGVITIIWIVGVTNAVNLLDNMDGAAAGISAAAAASIFAIAVLGEQPVTAILSAGAVGACVGFLVHNKPPASIFMGDTGSLFLGFVLAIGTINISPALRPPASFAIPVLLLALPVLDTATVTLSRLRRRRPVAQGGKDHLSHRLVNRGLSPGRAVAVLIAVEAVVGVFAVLAGRKVVPLFVALLATLAVLAALSWWTIGADVYTEEVVGLPRRLELAALAAVGVFVLLAAPAVVALGRAHGPGTAGAQAVRQGVEALGSGDSARAADLFDRASADLRRADEALSGGLTSLGLGIPVLRANLATTRAVVTASLDVAGAGSDLSSLVEASNLRLGPESDPGREAERLAPALASSASVLRDAARSLAGYNRPYLWPSLRTSVRHLRSALATAASESSVASDVAQVLPALLGQEAPRRYFLAIQDNTELRGSGGVIQFWAELEAKDGRLRLTRFGRIDELNQAAAGRARLTPELVARYQDFDVAQTWQNVNVSPDFSVTGQVIAELYPQSGGQALDGVVAVDLPGLAALLDLSGPVRVDGWPDPVIGANLVDVVVRESHVRFPDPDERRAFVGRIAESALRAFTEADLGSPASLALRLAPAVRARHLLFHASGAQEQELFRQLGMAGEVGGDENDSLLVVNQNLSATGIDLFLHRRVSYTMHLEPGNGAATLTGRVEVALRNEAPAAGLPPAVIGPVDSRLSPGENRTYLSIYTPLMLTGSRLDGEATVVGSDTEFGRYAYSAIVSVPPNESRTVGLDLRGQVRTDSNGWYRLELLQQTSLSPDDTEISLSVPSGWRIVEARGLEINGERRATATLRSDEGTAVAVRLQRTVWSRLWSRTAAQASAR